MSQSTPSAGLPAMSRFSRRHPEGPTTGQVPATTGQVPATTGQVPPVSPSPTMVGPMPGQPAPAPTVPAPAPAVPGQVAAAPTAPVPAAQQAAAQQQLYQQQLAQQRAAQQAQQAQLQQAQQQAQYAQQQAAQYAAMQAVQSAQPVAMPGPVATPAPAPAAQVPAPAAQAPAPAAQVATPTPVAEAAASAAARSAQGRRGFLHDLRSEWLKLWSVRSTYWTLIVGVLAMIAIVALMGISFAMTATQDQLKEQGMDPSAYSGYFLVSMGVGFAQLAFIVLAVMMVTNEYSSGTIRVTMANDPHRLPVMAAKAIVMSVVVFLAGALATALSTLMAAVMSPKGVEFKPFASDGPRVLIGIPLYLVAICLLALGVGFIVRNSAAGISIVLGWLLVAETLFSSLPVDWLRTVSKYLPGIAGQQVTMPGSAAFAQTSSALEPWPGFAVLCGWAVLVCAVAAFLLKKRDV